MLAKVEVVRGLPLFKFWHSFGLPTGSIEELAGAAAQPTYPGRRSSVGPKDPVALQLQVQAEGIVHLRHDLRRYPTQNRSDAFDGHRTQLFGLSL